MQRYNIFHSNCILVKNLTIISSRLAEINKNSNKSLAKCRLFVKLKPFLATFGFHTLNPVFDNKIKKGIKPLLNKTLYVPL